MSLDKNCLPEELNLFRSRLTPRFYDVRAKVIDFILNEVVPALPTYNAEMEALYKTVDHPTKAPRPPTVKILRDKAKALNLWNFFLPEVSQLSVLEYSPIAELTGAFPLAGEAMNCLAPDTGNMEVLEKFGTPEQKTQWLEPLLKAEIRSAFAMTEPGVASSDATNISTTIVRDGDDYVINGHKWYISGAIRPECKVFILLGKTRDDGPAHKRMSMILVPRDTPGVNILRPMAVFGDEHDHAEIIFENVRVPKKNLLLEEGSGFEIAQGRLGPGRIHHCMRTIGQAETALAAIVHRVGIRKAFGSVLSSKDSIREKIAEARLELTKSRLLCYAAAATADDKGFKDARVFISMTKVDAPRMALKIIDEAIQIHGAHGLSQDSELAELYKFVRHVRLADGPDIVHLNTIASYELAKGSSDIGRKVSGKNVNIEKYGKFASVYGKLTPHPGASKL
eukprot:TRINITY_DN6132_c0_g2_i6.p1 TRINITY_DN6132_c0_g2~~TRINITY_DN6132_c0_g2_i6.p1  ORF type:complete len:452 (+),score=85.40 TRINITY_DN6132_c0_g2_i6:37-1392(+)